jgi:hypothetical protein
VKSSAHDPDTDARCSASLTQDRSFMPTSQLRESDIDPEGRSVPAALLNWMPVARNDCA